MKPTKVDAIRSLVGNGVTSHADETFTFHNGQELPTEEKIQSKLTELQAEYDAQEYARTRAPLYPAIGDQLDDLYKKGAFSDEMAAKLKKVKDDNPKPS